MAKEKITHSICVGGPLTIHTDLATGRTAGSGPSSSPTTTPPDGSSRPTARSTPPSAKTTLSLLGFTEKDRTYSYDRIKYPMIREDFVETPDGQNRNTENRGKSGYRRASWDEALGLVAREIKRIQGTYGKEAVTAITSSHHSWGLCGYKISLFKRFFSMLGYTRIMDNPDSWEGFHWGTPHTYGYYWRLGGPEPFDMLHDAMKNTETMIMWSHDPDTTRGGYSAQESALWRWWMKVRGCSSSTSTPSITSPLSSRRTSGSPPGWALMRPCVKPSPMCGSPRAPMTRSTSPSMATASTSGRTTSWAWAPTPPPRRPPGPRRSPA